ncbi:hypothetical protein GHK29_32110 [Sinorhizobium medicae]|uniref:hypothetical protein n=1 Tax=Sinorhizobium medicae TaxID=110321 RepID=UPI0012962F72|nr:hypothetical protein [Sinorhizobium medicae]MDX1017042.1 hypothetical protein [Sinorhizobium medicae]MDX2388155.1 hypothetical protein [Sinorhizobium medicae]MQU79140.1 hypothetical protein [Sinorhizobium medicae]
MTGWRDLTQEDAIHTAADEHGKDATTSVAYCTLEAYRGVDRPEYRFWFGLFLKLANREHVGWA